MRGRAGRGEVLGGGWVDGWGGRENMLVKPGREVARVGHRRLPEAQQLPDLGAVVLGGPTVPRVSPPGRGRETHLGCQVRDGRGGISWASRGKWPSRRKNVSSAANPRRVGRALLPTVASSARAQVHCSAST